MFYWEITSAGIKPKQAEYLTPVMTAWGQAFRDDTTDLQVYVSPRVQVGLLTFRAYLLKSDAEASLEHHRNAAGFSRRQDLPKPAKALPPTLTFKVGRAPVGLPKVGDVYRCKGGKKTRYWLLVGLTDSTANLLGFNEAGEISSTINYGVHVLYGYSWSREKLGTVADFPQLKLNF